MYIVVVVPVEAEAQNSNFCNLTHVKVIQLQRKSVV